MMLIESGDDVIAVDCGLMFPDDELPGVDYVLPDFSYALAKRERFHGVVLTHGHEDHIGALPYLLKSARVPVYATPLTRALVAEKLREHPLPEPADLRLMRPREPFTLGPFTIEPIRVTHSIADGMGLAITTPVGTIVHTGDFKLDPSPLDGEPADTRRFAELGEQGVAVLCPDSTNVDRPGNTRSENEVGAALAERFDGATGRIILATFASHIHRIQQVLTLAAARGRQVALLGRSMEKNVAIASDLGYLGVPSGLLRPLEEVVALPAERQVILSTGSQGEPNSALALMAAGEHKYVQIARGDLVVISARVIPGNERTVGRVINALYRLGAEVLYEDNAFVHVSGPASQADLKLMLKLTQPRLRQGERGPAGGHEAGRARRRGRAGSERPVGPRRRRRPRAHRRAPARQPAGAAKACGVAYYPGGLMPATVSVDVRSEPRAPEASPPPRRRARKREAPRRCVREVQGIASMTAAGFLPVVLVVFDPAGAPAEQPSMVGPVGIWLAWASFRAFGYAAFLFPLAAGVWGASAFLRPLAARGWVPVAGLLLLLLAATGLFQQATDSFAATRVTRGGIVQAGGFTGWTTAAALHPTIGNAGAWLLLLNPVPVGALLVTPTSYAVVTRLLSARLVRLRKRREALRLVPAAKAAAGLPGVAEAAMQAGAPLLPTIVEPAPPHRTLLESSLSSQETVAYGNRRGH